MDVCGRKQTWKIDEEVKIRVEEVGEAARPPITTIQAFREIVERCGSANALHRKVNGEWCVHLRLEEWVNGWNEGN